jgi:hypothetical protein
VTKTTIAAGIIFAALFAGAASAQQAMYTWTGAGVNVRGASKCPGYKMTIDVTIDGQGNTIDVVGTINAGGSKIMLDGYCKFEGKLTKK